MTSMAELQNALIHKRHEEYKDWLAETPPNERANQFLAAPNDEYHPLPALAAKPELFLATLAGMSKRKSAAVLQFKHYRTGDTMLQKIALHATGDLGAVLKAVKFSEKETIEALSQKNAHDLNLIERILTGRCGEGPAPSPRLKAFRQAVGHRIFVALYKMCEPKIQRELADEMERLYPLEKLTPLERLQAASCRADTAAVTAAMAKPPHRCKCRAAFSQRGVLLSGNDNDMPSLGAGHWQRPNIHVREYP